MFSYLEGREQSWVQISGQVHLGRPSSIYYKSYNENSFSTHLCRIWDTFPSIFKLAQVGWIMQAGLDE